MGGIMVRKGDATYHIFVVFFSPKIMQIFALNSIGNVYQNLDFC